MKNNMVESLELISRLGMVLMGLLFWCFIIKLLLDKFGGNDNIRGI